MAADVLAHQQQLAVGIEQTGGVQPAGAAKAGLLEPVGQIGGQGAADRGSAGAGALRTATSSSAPLPQTPHEDVV